VLRITITDFPDEQRWSLEGRLLGPWAAELISLWRERRHPHETRKCVVELNHVTFIDRTGEAALTEIMSQGAEIIGGGVYTKQKFDGLRTCSKLSPLHKAEE
jgi:ABC-type transporter Mla MlaB component